MNCVNNCLMSNTLDAQDIALEKLKNVLVIFEKKKRNLDKRKNRLEEYKKKKDLNEDQQMAVSKYQEVVSNLELLEELNGLALQQVREAEKTFKKAKKQEKIELKRHEAFLIEFVMKTYHILDRVINNDKVQSRLLSENVIDVTDLNLIRELFYEIHISDLSNWKKCSEQLQSLYEGGNKPMDLTGSDERLLRTTPKDVLLKCIEKVSNIDWLDNTDWEVRIDEEKTVEEISGNEEETEIVVPKDQIIEQEQQQQSVLIKEHEVAPLVQPMEKLSVQHESPKLNFIFLHESLVQDEGHSKSGENGCSTVSGVVFNNDHDQVPRSSHQQMSAKTAAVNNANSSNNVWQPATNENAVDDVFSSATQSEFMHSDNSRNLKPRAPRQASNGNRFRAGGTPPQQSNFSASRGGSGGVGTGGEGLGESANFWKSNSRGGGGSFNSNSRYPRSARGGMGRNRGGSGRNDYRQSNDEAIASMQ